MAGRAGMRLVALLARCSVGREAARGCVKFDVCLHIRGGTEVIATIASRFSFSWTEYIKLQLDSR